MIGGLTGTLDYTRRIAMIPMRDGVNLHTAVLVQRIYRSSFVERRARDAVLGQDDRGR